MASPRPRKMQVAELMKARAPYNPNEMDEDERRRLAASVERFDAVQTVVFNLRTNTVVGGHHLIEEADTLGKKSLWAMQVDLSPEEERALNLALNRVRGHWNDEKLRAVLQDLQQSEAELVDASGFEVAEIEELLAAEQDDEGSSPPAKVGDPGRTLVSLSKEQAAPFLRAVKRVRARKGNADVSKADCLAIVCKEWLGRRRK